MVHDVGPGQAGAVDEQLEGELQPRVHLPAARLALAFLAAPLQRMRGKTKTVMIIVKSVTSHQVRLCQIQIARETRSTS